MFHRKSQNTGTNWINLCSSHTLILTVFPKNGLSRKGKLKEWVRKKAQTVLSGYKRIEFIAAWLAKVAADRPHNPATHAPKRMRR
jgi:hypothetical protein